MNFAPMEGRTTTITSAMTAAESQTLSVPHMSDPEKALTDDSDADQEKY